MTDTNVVCDECGRKSIVAFAACLAAGWPKCCGCTMRLASTSADIEADTRRATDRALPSRMALRTGAAVTHRRMQMRRDAFLMLTEEKPPAEPNRWLVVWGEGEAFQWRAFTDGADAYTFVDDELCVWDALVYDLDNQ